MSLPHDETNFGIGTLAAEQDPMIMLYSYPELFGVADNNGYWPEGLCLSAAKRRAVQA